MSLFVVAAVLMTVVALAFMLLPLSRAGGDALSRRLSNLEVLRDQRTALDLERQRGSLSVEDYQQAIDELEQRVLAESEAHEPTVPPVRSRAVPMLVLAAVPILATVMYAWLGAPMAIDARPSQAAAAPPTAEQIAADVAEARKRVAANPKDAESWLLIARGSVLTDELAAAVDSYEKVLTLAPKEPEPMLELAELLSRQQGSLAGRPTELIEQALQVAPNYWKALALAGRAAFDRGDYQAAITYWQTLRSQVPAESTALAAIDQGLEQARAKIGASPATAEGSAAAVPAAVAGAEAVAGTVTLAPALREKAGADDTLFVFARHASGPRMPLAVLRKKVSDLPLTFSLDDSLAMSPQLRLSTATQIVVTARVSKSGTVMPGTGDLQGESAPVPPGTAGLAIEISKELP